jgi:hypothetical protein
MARQYGAEKVNLIEALKELRALEPVGYSVLVAALIDRFGCARRTAEDAVSILQRGRWVESTPRSPRIEEIVQPSPYDKTRRYYRVSERGHYLVRHRNGGGVLRLARKLFTICPSPNVKRHRDGLIAQHGDADAALDDFERKMLASRNKNGVR